MEEEKIKSSLLWENSVRVMMREQRAPAANSAMAVAATDLPTPPRPQRS